MHDGQPQDADKMRYEKSVPSYPLAGGLKTSRLGDRTVHAGVSRSVLTVSPGDKSHFDHWAHTVSHAYSTSYEQNMCLAFNDDCMQKVAHDTAMQLACSYSLRKRNCRKSDLTFPALLYAQSGRNNVLLFKTSAHRAHASVALRPPHLLWWQMSVRSSIHTEVA